MTSKEALEFIIETFNELAQKPQDIGLFFKFCGAHEKVKQDLDRLEVLENLVADDCIAGKQVGLSIVDALIERGNKYKDELKKYKMAIEILKRYFNFEIHKNTFYIKFLDYEIVSMTNEKGVEAIHRVLGNEQIDILKEVLKDE